MKAYTKNTGRELSIQIYTALFAIASLLTLSTTKTMAQDKKQMVRIAKIQVDPLQLEKYNAALNEQMKTAVRLEPGVLTYYAVADKKNPASITILEIYANSAAYQAHILTSHFLKYKKTVEHMVKELKLEDVDLIGVALKPTK
jgi:quinol monooxygenase YgiN